MPADVRRSSSFRRQLAATVAVSTALVLLGSAVVTAFLVSAWIKSALLTHMDHMVREFATRSVLVYLSRDASLAKNTADTLRSLPSVESVVFLDLDYQALFGGASPSKPALEQARDRTRQGDHWEDLDAFHFLAPVETRPPASPFNPASPAYSPETLRLGYVHVALGKAPLERLASAILAIHMGLAMMFGALLLIGINLRFRRLTAPLSALAQAMRRAGEAPQGVRAEVAGPTEAQDIARVFNQMIERIENHQAILESEVATRTSELREARDAALTASRVKSEFLSMLTHEIRTPLTSISGHTELTLEELRFIENTEEAIERLRLVLDTSHDLLSILDEILTYAKAEAGTADLTLSPVDLEKLTTRVAASVQPMRLKHRNELRAMVTGEPTVIVDENKLFHIVLNLVSNACKFTENGHIELAVDARPEALRVTVSDTGMGIPKDRQAIVFEPFRQADMGDTRQAGGVGLGLAITKRFCEMLNGRIGVQSEEHVGSTFWVHIPLPVQLKPDAPGPLKPAPDT